MQYTSFFSLVFCAKRTWTLKIIIINSLFVHHFCFFFLCNNLLFVFMTQLYIRLTTLSPVVH